METVISSIITGVFALFVALITYNNRNLKANKESKNDHDMLSKEQAKIVTCQKKIESEISFLKDERLKEVEKYESLSKKQLDVKKTTDHINAIADLVVQLQLENSELKEENKGLKKTTAIPKKIKNK